MFLSTLPEGEDVSVIPLPNMGRNVSDVSRLVMEKQADGSVEKVLCLAGKSEQGFAFVEGIVDQNAEDGLVDVKQEMEKAEELVSLSEVFDFQDSYFENDPVPTPVEELPEEVGVDIPLPEEVGVELPLPEEVCAEIPLPEEVGAEIPLPEEVGVEIPLPNLVGSDSDKLGIVQQEDESVGQEPQAVGFLEQFRHSDQKGVAEFRFVQNYAVNSVALTKATEKSSPDRVHCCDFMFAVFLYFNFALCVVLSLHLLSSQFILLTDVSGVGRRAVLWVLRSREELPEDFYSWIPQPRKRMYSLSPFGFLWRRMKTPYLDLWSFRGGGGRCHEQPPDMENRRRIV